MSHEQLTRKPSDGEVPLQSSEGMNNNSYAHVAERYGETQNVNIRRDYQEGYNKDYSDLNYQHQEYQQTNNVARSARRSTRRVGLEEDPDEFLCYNNRSITSIDNNNFNTGRRRSIPRRPSFGQESLTNIYNGNAGGGGDGSSSRLNQEQQQQQQQLQQYIEEQHAIYAQIQSDLGRKNGSVDTIPKRNQMDRSAADIAIAPSTPTRQQYEETYGSKTHLVGINSVSSTPVIDNRNHDQQTAGEQTAGTPSCSNFSITSSQATPTKDNTTTEGNNIGYNNKNVDDNSGRVYVPSHQQQHEHQIAFPSGKPELLSVPSLTDNPQRNNTVRVKRHHQVADSNTDGDDKLSKLQHGLLLIDDTIYNDIDRRKKQTKKYDKKNPKDAKMMKTATGKPELATAASSDDEVEKKKRIFGGKFFKEKKKDGKKIKEDENLGNIGHDLERMVFSDRDDYDYDECVLPGAVAVKDGSERYRNKGADGRPSSFYSVDSMNAVVSTTMDQYQSSHHHPHGNICDGQLEIPTSMAARQQQSGNGRRVGPQAEGFVPYENVNQCRYDSSTEMITSPLPASLAPPHRHPPSPRIVYQPQNQPIPLSDIEVGRASSNDNGKGTKKEETEWFCSKSFMIVLCILIVIGIATGVTLPLVMSSSPTNDGSSDRDSSHSTNSTETLQPTTEEVDFVKRKESIFDLLTSTVALDVTLNDNATTAGEEPTPQSLAFEWIVFNDTTYSIDPSSSSENTNNVRLIQRYIFAVFYYSTNGKGWLLQHNWLDTATDECDWKYLSCNALGQVTGIEVGERNKLTGPIPLELSFQTSLERLIVNKNSISALPFELRSLSNTLTTLRFEENRADSESRTRGSLSTNSTIPPVVYELTSLEDLTLVDCNLLGTISTDISKLQNLRQLRLGHNKLHGIIPRALYENNPILLSNIERIDLGGNFMNLQGNLTDIITGLAVGIGASATAATNLENFGIFGNQLIGSIPTDIGFLTSLSLFSVEHNEISGTIPSEVGMLTNMENLYLNKNHLVGTVPSEIGNLINLKRFWFDTNDLSGSVPEEICNNIDAFNPENGDSSSSVLESDPPLVRDCSVRCFDLDCCERCNG